MASGPNRKPQDVGGDALETLLATRLAEPLRGAETLRRRTLRWILLWTLPCLALGIAGIALLVHFELHEPWAFVFGAAMLMAVLIPASRKYSHYRSHFKQAVVAPLVQVLGKGLRYRWDRGISLAEFQASGLFRERSVECFDSEDLFEGRLGATNVHFAEVHARYLVRSGKTTREVTLFRGLYFSADFNKHFRGRTYVLPDTAQRLFGGFGQTLQGLSRQYGKLVKLEDPEFERLFVVYGEDQIEARYLLSSALMARLVEFRKRSGHDLRIGFVESRLLIAVSLDRDLFEPRLFSSLHTRALYREFHRDLELFSGIVEELSLNTRIWSKR